MVSKPCLLAPHQMQKSLAGNWFTKNHAYVVNIITIMFIIIFGCAQKNWGLETIPGYISVSEISMGYLDRTLFHRKPHKWPQSLLLPQEFHLPTVKVCLALSVSDRGRIQDVRPGRLFFALCKDKLPSLKENRKKTWKNVKNMTWPLQLKPGCSGTCGGVCGATFGGTWGAVRGACDGGAMTGWVGAGTTLAATSGGMLGGAVGAITGATCGAGASGATWGAGIGTGAGGAGLLGALGRRLSTFSAGVAGAAWGGSVGGLSLGRSGSTIGATEGGRDGSGTAMGLGLAACHEKSIMDPPNESLV